MITARIVTPSTAVKKQEAPLPGVFQAAPTVLWAVLVAILKTIFSLDARQSANRTAIFMMFFLLIHVSGNLLVFSGADLFNAYGHVLHVNPLLKIIEGYLLLAGVIHAIVGTYLTFNKRKYLTSGKTALTNLDRAKLAFSGTMVSVFIVVHLRQFKFGAWYDYLSTMDVMLLSESGLETVPKGTAMRDIFRLEKEVFGQPLNAWGYVLAICALGGHMWWGWEKAVDKLGLEKEFLPAAKSMGQFFIGAICLGFISQPMYVLYGM